jgi:ABC-type Mn2+/Zn2+ transport system permease subunit
MTTSPHIAMFEYDFMTNSFVAAGTVAVVSGLIGFFLVMRGQTFAGHALSHVGFAGATVAGLIGLAPLWGLLGFTLAAGVGMGLLGERIRRRDVAIGVVLALALGFGLLFLHYHTAFAAEATAILFGTCLPSIVRPSPCWLASAHSPSLRLSLSCGRSCSLRFSLSLPRRGGCQFATCRWPFSQSSHLRFLNAPRLSGCCSSSL